MDKDEKPCDSIEEMFAEIEQWTKDHPIRYRWGRLTYELGFSKIKFRLKKATVWRRQRAKRGWSEYDTYSFDLYLARVISEGLLHLRDNTHGYPYDETEDSWTDMLNKIIEGFRAHIRMYSEALPDKELNVAQKTFDEGMALFSSEFASFWD